MKIVLACPIIVLVHRARLVLYTWVLKGAIKSLNFSLLIQMSKERDPLTHTKINLIHTLHHIWTWPSKEKKQAVL